jgi:type II secretory pathway component PulC
VESSLKLKAVLISDRIQLASIDRSIVTVGDLVNGEKVLEIRSDRVILEKEGKKRTILLDQSPVKITVEGR